MIAIPKIILLGLLCLTLSSCSSVSGKRASLGSKPLVASIAQQALAFQINEDFGKSLTGKDKEALTSAERQALEYGVSGQSVDWAGNTSKVRGGVIAFRPFRVGQSNCRRFEHHIITPKINETIKGTACQQGEGAWKLIR